MRLIAAMAFGLIMAAAAPTALAADQEAQPETTAAPAPMQRYYIEIIGEPMGPNAKAMNISLNFGAVLASELQVSTKELREMTKELGLRSMIDAMNMLGRNGWQLISTETTTSPRGTGYRWIATKQVGHVSEVLDGLIH